MDGFYHCSFAFSVCMYESNRRYGLFVLSETYARMRRGPPCLPHI